MNKKKEFQCITCLKTFAHKQSLRRHLKTHSTDKKPNDKSIQNDEPPKRKSEDDKENEIKRRKTDDEAMVTGRYTTRTRSTRRR